MKYCLITGCSGFIGRHLVAALQRHGVHIRGLTRQRPETVGLAGVEWLRADLAQAGSLAGACRDIDTVFHAAGHAHALRSDPGVHWQTTLEGTRRLLAEAQTHGVARFVFISSVKAMPEPGNDCLDESETGLPADAYGLSRRRAEDLVLEAGQRSGMHVSILRPTLVYGPGCKGNLLNMMKQIERGRFPPVPDTGNIRSMVDVRDLVDALLLAAGRPQANGRVFIISDGEDYSTRRIYAAMRAAAGRSVPRLAVPAVVLRLLGRAGDAYQWLLRRPAPFDSRLCSRLLDSACYRSNCAADLLGFAPQYRFEDSVGEMLAACREPGPANPGTSPGA